MEIISDDGEGSTVEEGVTSVKIASDEVVLVLRKDMTYRLLVPAVGAEENVPENALSLIAITLRMKADPDWLDDVLEEVFGDPEDYMDIIDVELDKPLGPETEGSA